MKEDQKIVIYQTPDGKTQIDVRLEDETVWLTQAQIISNVFKEGELVREEVSAKIAHTTRHGAIKGKLHSQRDWWLARYQKSTSNLHGVDLFFSMSSFSGRLRLLVEGVSPINGDAPRIGR